MLLFYARIIKFIFIVSAPLLLYKIFISDGKFVFVEFLMFCDILWVHSVRFHIFLDQWYHTRIVIINIQIFFQYQIKAAKFQSFFQYVKIIFIACKCFKSYSTDWNAKGIICNLRNVIIAECLLTDCFNCERDKRIAIKFFRCNKNSRKCSSF